MNSKKYNRKGTKTSSFGSSGRINHDSSSFYSSKIFENVMNDKIQYVENKIDPKFLNNIFCNSSVKMNELPDNSVHLMVTSPPYNVQKEYESDLSLEEYFHLVKSVMTEVYRVLVPGGRACINIANVGRKPYIPLHSYLIKDMIEIGYLMRGEIIWDKGASGGVSTAWGSWLSASNPVLRDKHEYILIFSKDTFSLKSNKKKSTIDKKSFLENTLSIWTFPTVSAKKVGHPAPFPIELPKRLIQLFTFQEDIVLDPFCGSGTTCISALKENRNFIGYDIKQEYVDLSLKNIKNIFENKNQENLVFK
ncbi:MAG: site-specific DNA-methyltransferase [Ignavibacteriae bacterium]|nr:site-specific DNA-methyltransferase [Ignavibacteriota bacterium]